MDVYFYTANYYSDGLYQLATVWFIESGLRQGLPATAGRGVAGPGREH